MQANSRGFTLLEVFVVLVVTSLLVTLAYPSYMSYVHKSQRVDAKNSLFYWQAQWLQCLQHVHDADACLTTLGLGVGVTHDSLAGHYVISSEQRVDGMYLSAHAQGMQSQDVMCATFLLGEHGVTLAFDAAGDCVDEACW